MKIKDLEYFQGRVCTIFTIPTNRDFKSENPNTFPQPVFHYFVGKILEINSHGVTLEQWNNNKKLRSFFFLQHIVGLSEEEILNPNDPKDAKEIDSYKELNKKAPEKAEKQLEKLKEQREILKDQEINIGELSNLSDSMMNQGKK